MWEDSTGYARSAATIWTPGRSAIADGKPKNRKETMHMSKSTVELPGGGCATESEALNALVREANRRNISYGMLVANTTEQERKEIIQAYCMERWPQRRGKRYSY